MAISSLAEAFSARPSLRSRATLAGALLVLALASSAEAQNIVYYSVGTSTADLKLATNITINPAGTATFSAAQPNNIGVGDAVTFGATTVYISGRTSSTVYSVTNRLGVAAGIQASTPVTSIRRAFNCFESTTCANDAVTGSIDATHLNNASLTAVNVQLNWACYNDGPMNDQVSVVGYTTDATRFIRIYTPVYKNQVGVSQRHTGRAGTGFRMVPNMGNDVDTIRIFVNNVRVEGIEIDGSQDAGSPNGCGGVTTETGGVGVHYISHNIVHHTRGFTAIWVQSATAYVWNNIVYEVGNQQFGAVSQNAGTAYFYNNTVYNHDWNANAAGGIQRNAGTLVARNNVSMIATPVAGTDFIGTMTANNNVSSDATSDDNGGAGNQINKTADGTYFVDVNPTGGLDLHLAVDSTLAGNFGGAGADLDHDANLPVGNDIDSGPRSQTAPDMGADEWQSTTAVTLASFAARGFDSGVAVEWETGSELDNLGFNVYRGLSENGPWQRLNASLIPGLGSSLEGKRYGIVDSGLTNGLTYYYRLEDLDRSGLVTSHGPVAAVPVAGLAAPADGAGSGAPGIAPGAPWKAHGDPTDVSLRVLRRSARSLTLELHTGGFYTQAQPDGTVRLHVPGFFDTIEPGLPALPVKRTWIDAVVGRDARIASVQTGDVRSFPELLPVPAGAPLASAQADGTFRAVLRRVPSKKTRGLYPPAAARVVQTAFQEHAKRAYLELAPLRVDGPRRRLVLAGRLVVTVVFGARVAGERAAFGSGGRREPRLRDRPDRPTPNDPGVVVARLASRASGAHAVSWESLSGAPGLRERGRQLSTSSLRLSRLGQPVAFHVEPRADRFGPGSTLYFLAEGPEAAYGSETVYELAIAAGGLQMSVGAVNRQLPKVRIPALVATRVFEENTNHLPGLLEARDRWLWDTGLLAPNGRDYSFVLSAPSGDAGPGRLTVELQGGSDAPALATDHVVHVLVNGVPLGDARWDGLHPGRFEASVDPSVLVDGANTLRLENVDTTGAQDSVVYLDRFSLEYGRQTLADGGRLEGRAPASGLVRAAGFASGALLVELSGAKPSWLAASTSGSEIVFAAEAQKRYLAVAPEAVQRPELRLAETDGSLRETSLQADWIVIAPRDLLSAAEPLVAQREAQGLAAMAVPLERIQDEFGYGERSPQMLRDFLAYAYHHWSEPSPRYVLLLGDASYDPKGYLASAARKDLLPTPQLPSTFLWTASDPSLAAVNGDDAIPDLAIGRLSALTRAEAEAAVQKVLEFERSAQDLGGSAVLVADNADAGGSFELDADEIAALLSSRPVERLYLASLGAGTRGAVMGAFDSGASLVSYVGHGSQALWASEAILRSIDAPLLQEQPRQPLMLTMTCANGYFISPFLNSLAERFVLEARKGAIAAFSPSGLSLDESAHVYHRALVTQLESGRHERLGDLVLAAQRDYADSGAFPELLSIYHLFGDPALRIR